MYADSLRELVVDLTTSHPDYVDLTSAIRQAEQVIIIIPQLYFTKTGRDKKNNKTDKKNLTRKT